MKQTKDIVEKIETVSDPIAEKHFHKERYLVALRENGGQLDEALLGQKLGFSREYTQGIIEELLSDGKVISQASKTCRYKVA